MRSVALILSLLIVTLVPAQDIYFVWLVRGNGPRPPAPELQKMQDAHIANFVAQGKRGKLFMAGPVQDPGVNRRGIVVVKARGFTELADLFDEDPYVQGRIMNLQAAKWDVDLDKIGKNIPDSAKIAENRIVVISANGEVSEEEAIAQRRYLDRYAPVNGRLYGVSGYQAIAFFRGKDDAAIQSVLERSPLGKAKKLQFEMFPQWLSDGVLPAPARAR